LEKKWESNGTVHHLFIDSEKAYIRVRREVLYHILIEFAIPMKLVRLTKMCLNEIYTKVRRGKNLSDASRIQNGLKQGDGISSLLFNLLYNIPSERSKKIRKNWNSMEHISSWSVLTMLICWVKTQITERNVQKLC
jgi:hypothetical protein